MQRLQAYTYELISDGHQKRSMSRFAGSCRFVYNNALALQKDCCEAGEKKHGYAALCRKGRMSTYAVIDAARQSSSHAAAFLRACTSQGSGLVCACPLWLQGDPLL